MAYLFKDILILKHIGLCTFVTDSNDSGVMKETVQARELFRRGIALFLTENGVLQVHLLRVFITCT